MCHVWTNALGFAIALIWEHWLAKQKLLPVKSTIQLIGFVLLLGLIGLALVVTKLKEKRK